MVFYTEKRRPTMQEENTDRVYESFKRTHDITKIRSETDVVEEHAIRWLVNRHLDDPEVAQALADYYNKNNYIPSPNIILISDTHLGGRYGQYRLVDSVYNFAIQNNISHIVHLGDVIEGDVDKSALPKPFFSQLDELVEKYPKVNGITTHYIQGNHDISNPRDVVAPYSAVRDCLEKRDDFHWLGTLKTYINFNGHPIYLFHKEAYGLTVPLFPVDYQFSGHSHYLSLDTEKRNLKAAPLCTRASADNIGFLLIRQSNVGYITDFYNLSGQTTPKYVKSKVLEYPR